MHTFLLILTLGLKVSRAIHIAPQSYAAVCAGVLSRSSFLPVPVQFFVLFVCFVYFVVVCFFGFFCYFGIGWVFGSLLWVCIHIFDYPLSVNKCSICNAHFRL